MYTLFIVMSRATGSPAYGDLGKSFCVCLNGMEAFLPKAEVSASILKSSSWTTPSTPATSAAQPLRSFQTPLTFSTRMRSPTWMFELFTFTVPAEQQTNKRITVSDHSAPTGQQGPGAPTSRPVSLRGSRPAPAVASEAQSPL